MNKNNNKPSWYITCLQMRYMYFFQLNNTDLFLHKNIGCGYSLKVPHWGTFNEYPQHMFSWRNKKNIIWISPPIMSYDITSWKHIHMKATRTSIQGTVHIWYIFWLFCWGRQLLQLPVNFPAHQAHSEKGSTRKGKNSNSFLLEQIPFQKGG